MSLEKNSKTDEESEVLFQWIKLKRAKSVYLKYAMAVGMEHPKSKIFERDRQNHDL